MIANVVDRWGIWIKNIENESRKERFFALSGIESGIHVSNDPVEAGMSLIYAGRGGR
jgi:hypothetical protein